MSFTLVLMGSPGIEPANGVGPAVRGRKPWAVLAYVLLSGRATSRAHLASLLFSDAGDPLAALRWSIASLRRALGPDVSIGGDPVQVVLPTGAQVDVLDIQAGRWSDVEVPGELLESFYFRDSPGFEAWLLVTRRRLTALVEAVLVERIHTALAQGTAAGAIGLAARLVESNPLDESHQALLIRCLADSGDPAAAQRQLAAATRLLRAEFAEPPSASLRAAAVPRANPIDPNGAGGTAGAAEIWANLDAGRAAIAAGAVDAGIDCLRTAVTGAEAGTDRALLARALSIFGASLVRVGNSFLEAETMLRRGLAAAVNAGDDQSAGVAQRELGFLHVQAGYRLEGEQRLATATALAGGDDSQLASILGIQGMSLCDEARYLDARTALQDSLACAQRAQRHRKAGWSLAMLGRLQLLLGELDEAAESLDEAARIARGERWSAFLPWPEALGAEVELAQGRPEAARQHLEHASALAQRSSDPGLQAFATHGLAGVAAATGAFGAALNAIDNARRQACRGARPYVWIQAQILARRAALFNAHRPDQVDAALDEWIGLSARAGLREDIVRAQMVAAGRGRPGALEATAALAAGIDNPLLHCQLFSTLPLRGPMQT